MSTFTHNDPSLESQWRSIILFGRNVASYKFALAKSLLEFADKESTFIKLEDLAVPFSAHLCEHLKLCDKQITSNSSNFLKACRDFNNGQINKDDLILTTVKSGFNNVIDAFHVVNQGIIPIRFYEDQRSSSNKGIVITDDLLRLKESLQFNNFSREVEARWRLVETSWELGLSQKSLEVFYDGDSTLINPNYERQNISSCRDTLNGYQKGKCFYCFSDISVISSTSSFADIDHFFPHILKKHFTDINLDGIWNLVLTCQLCNRGEDGKFTKIPTSRLLDRLHRRNSFYIESHHPLRETLIMQTGDTSAKRIRFLQNIDHRAIQHLIHRWEPAEVSEACF